MINFFHLISLALDLWINFHILFFYLWYCHESKRRGENPGPFECNRFGNQYGMACFSAERRTSVKERKRQKGELASSRGGPWVSLLNITWKNGVVHARRVRRMIILARSVKALRGNAKTCRTELLKWHCSIAPKRNALEKTRNNNFVRDLIV